MIGRLRGEADAVLSRPPLVDAFVFSLVALSLGIELGGAWAFRDPALPPHWPVALALTVPMVLVVLLRRRAPMVVWATATAAQFTGILVIGFVTNPWPGSFTAEWCMYVGVYAVASRRSLRWTAAAVLIGTLAFVPITAKFRCECMIQLFTFLSFAAIAGVSTAAGARLIEELRWQGGLLQRTRAERLRLAVEQERSRVARDLHDVVAHAVTVTVVQAGAARIVARTNTRRAAKMLAQVQAVAAEALVELRSLVGSLAEEGGERPAASLPSSRDIPSLVEDEAAIGGTVDLEVIGPPDGPDSAMEISLYRIVQEALTNARKHAPGAKAKVILRHTLDSVEVEVVNGPPAAQAEISVQGFGRGLIGIRERAKLFGGEASAESTLEGGFRVSVRLPVALHPA